MHIHVIYVRVIVKKRGYQFDSGEDMDRVGRRGLAGAERIKRREGRDIMIL